MIAKLPLATSAKIVSLVRSYKKLVMRFLFIIALVASCFVVSPQSNLKAANVSTALVDQPEDIHPGLKNHILKDAAADLGISFKDIKDLDKAGKVEIKKVGNGYEVKVHSGSGTLVIILDNM